MKVTDRKGVVLMREETGLELIEFEGFHIRRIWVEETERWWFAVVNVVNALTDSKDPNKYWYDMKRREKEVELSAICRKFRMEAANGRHYQTECADTEGVLRIIQSIPSPEAESFKRWLAKVGYERIRAVENPELAAERAKALYKAKGFSDEWTEDDCEVSMFAKN
ncbi:MAG: Bro-N domain-containing protein [Chloroflexota bacterium]